MNQLQIVIPCVNEAQALPRLLRDLNGQLNVEYQLRVADGGSTDDTVTIAEQAGATVLSGARGRGRQMNAAAHGIDDGYLLFLHADSRLESRHQLEQALAMIRTARRTLPGEPVAGHFALRFEGQSRAHAALYEHMECKTRLNRRLTINGDQGVLIHAGDFHALGGFDESLPFLEDLRFAHRVFERGHWIRLPGALHTSARRFEAEGPRRRYLLMGLIGTMNEVGLHAFFDDTDALYAEQRDARQLDLQPWVSRARRLLLSGGPRRVLRNLWRLGRATRDQFWHLPYWIDRWREQRVPGPAMQRWDRHLVRWLNNPIGTALGMFVGVLLIYGPFVWIWAAREPRQL